MKLTIYFRARDGERLHGTAEASRGKVAFSGLLRAHEGSTVLEPNTFARLNQNDGERFLRAFARQMSCNPYLRLEFERDATKAKPEVIVSAGGNELRVAAAVAGLKPNALEEFAAMTLDQVRARIAELEATRIAREVRS